MPYVVIVVHYYGMIDGCMFFLSGFNINVLHLSISHLGWTHYSRLKDTLVSLFVHVSSTQNRCVYQQLQ